MTKEIKTTTVSFQEYSSIDFTPPSRYFIRDALDNCVFYHTRKREEAQTEVDKLYGEKFYVIQNANYYK